MIELSVCSEVAEIEEAQQHLKHWQRELRLDGMDIDLRIVPRGDWGSTMGQTNVDPQYHQTVIRLRHPDDRCPQEKISIRYDLETVIVHELLHVREHLWVDHPKLLEAMKDDTYLKQRHEDALDAVAEALVRARRGEKR